jgi:hypothetical protein
MSCSDLEPESSAQQAVKRYRKGMKDLGRSLILLAVLQLLVLALVFGLHRENTVLLALLGGLAGIHVLFGILAIQMQVWVNYLVIVWGALILVLNVAALGMVQDSQRGGPNCGQFIGMLIAGALIYYANKNLQEYKRVKAGGLNP